MEVVSPLASFARVNQGAKRRFGSPIHGGPSSTADSDFDMDCTGYDFQAAKRRKRFSNEGHGNTNNSFSSGQAKENWSFSPFIPSAPRSPQSHAASAGKLPDFLAEINTFDNALAGGCYLHQSSP